MALFLAANLAAGVAMAKDGDSGGGSGNSGSGSNNSGSGSSGGGGNDDDDDDDRDDDSGEENDGRGSDDHERAIRVVKRGKAVSLGKLKSHLADVYPGKILDVSLRRTSGVYFYNIRILAKGNRIKRLSLDALTLKPRGN